tara:strand:- start:61 stop:546 length:486 start_codon:yes stop_codon:yes gene_type:complete
MQMSTNYSEYSQKELLEALDSIDKDLYPKNYEKLVSEISKRDPSSKSMTCINESQLATERSSQINITPCSLKRVTTVVVLGLLGSIPVVAQAEPSKLSPKGLFYSVIILLIMGLPLLHSFVSGWTISRHGIVTRQKDNLLFTVMQLFYSYICSLVILFAIV